MPIDRRELLSDLRRQLRLLERDLAARADGVPEMAAALQAEYQAARAAERTAATFRVWRAGELTQAAVAWLLGAVFVRFIEDNGLIDEPLISGPAPRHRSGGGAPAPLLSLPSHRDRPRLPASRVRHSRPPAGAGHALRPRPQPGVAPRHLRRRRARPAGVLAHREPGHRGAAPRLHRLRVGHSLPGRPVPGPVRRRQEALRPCCRRRSSSRSSSWSAR